MSNEKLFDFNIKTIPKLIESDKTETYLNYVTGGLVGGSICGGLIFILSPKIILVVTATKLITTIIGMGIGSYVFDTNSLNYYEKMHEIKEQCVQLDSIFIRNLNNNKYDYIYITINSILTDKENPIGEINNRYLELYKRYDAPLHVLKYHIKQLTDLINYVYSINTYTQNIINYVTTCTEKSICNQMYNYITSIIREMSIEYNTEFLKKKKDTNIQLKITDNITKYRLYYTILIELINDIPKATNVIDKIACIEKITTEITDQLQKKNKMMTADDLLDILSYLIINSSIDNPYDEITYMNEYMNKLHSSKEYLVVSFNASVDFIRLS